MKKITCLMIVVLSAISTIGQNTAYGTGALFNNTTGTNNAAFGTNSLYNNNIGSENTALGEQVLFNNLSGLRNIGIGWNALKGNLTGGGNIAIGVLSLQNNLYSGGNVAVGDYTLPANISGWNNIALGPNALFYNTSGANNIAIGASAGSEIQTGNFNTILGVNWSGLGIVSGNANTIIGSKVSGLASNLSNTVILADGDGNQRLYINSIGNAGLGTTTPNEKLEINSGISDVSGLRFTQLTSASLSPASNGKTLTVDATGNVILTMAPGSGGGGLDWSLTGNAGTLDGTHFIGTTDMRPFNIRVNNLQSGKIDGTFQNVFLGYRAGINNNTTVWNNKGTQNVAIGDEAMYSNQYGFANTAIGFNALHSLVGSTSSTHAGNVAMGWRALYLATLGSDNTAVGTMALYNSTGIDKNSAFGTHALLGNTTGGLNTAAGGYSLRYNTTGSNNAGFGYDANVSLGNFQYSTVIGSDAIGNASNKVVIGRNAPTVIGGYAAWSNYSDGRFKENVKEEVPGLTFINQLRPVTYTINVKKLDEHIMQDLPDSIREQMISSKSEVYTEAEKKIQTGFIAQEVEKSAMEIGYDFDGVNIPKNHTDNYSIAYSQFIMPLVKSVQELSAQNETMKKEIEELKALITKNNLNAAEGSIRINEINHNAKLFQNSPNPFNRSTIISYSLPSKVKKAVITITSSNGIKIKEYDLIKNAGQVIEIAAGQLTAGTYFYSLYIEGALVDTKQMILTR